MKGQRFTKRLGYALAGLRAVYRSEASFRTQLRLACAAIAFVLVIRPPAIWAALVVLATALVLAAETFNAAIERLADAVHPDHHPLIGIAKDAAAAGVLIASVAALCVGAALAYSCFSYT